LYRQRTPISESSGFQALQNSRLHAIKVDGRAGSPSVGAIKDWISSFQATVSVSGWSITVSARIS
jgi:hypothetical protein